MADPSDGWTDPDDSSDDLDLESETDEEKKAAEEAEKNRLGEDDSLDLLDDEDALDMIEEEPTEENTGDLLEQEIGKDVIGGEGEDNSTIYRGANHQWPYDSRRGNDCLGTIFRAVPEFFVQKPHRKAHGRGGSSAL